MNKFLIAAIALLLVLQPTFAQRKKKGDEELVRPPQPTRVLSLDKQQQVDSGAFVYALPRTVFRVSVVVERTVFTAGPYAAYAKKYLGLSVKSASETRYAIARSSVAAYTEADARQLYVVQPGDDGVRFDFFKMTKDGLMLSVENFSQPESNASRSFDSSSSAATFTNMGVESMFREVRKPIATAPDTADVDGEEEVEEQFLVTLQPKTEEEMAAEAANFLLSLRKRKFELLTGDIDAAFGSNDALKVALTELNKMERSCLSLFVGKRTTSQRTYHYDVAPAAVMDSYPLFKFSEKNGVQNMDAQGSTVALDVQPEDKYAGAKTSPVQKDDAALKMRLPDVAQVRLLNGSSELYRGRFWVHQNGKVVNVRFEQFFDKEIN
ncbi:MAG: DUF4831 family protein [Prevotellaceae bacterium]|jgi:hypothetical protein|nr:DUF4831 family protein [Prevotellaceae bacterium]